MNNATTNEALNEAVGKTIKSIEVLEEDSLFRDGVVGITFTNGAVLLVYDGGRGCCEHRYPHTDEDLSYASGAKILSIEVTDSESTDRDEYYDVQEICFLNIHTDKKTFVFQFYNVHNGYYGGFSIKAEYAKYGRKLEPNVQ